MKEHDELTIICRIAKIGPQKLHFGDIVDVGFSMIAIEKKGESGSNEADARLLLRSIMLLDATHTQVNVRPSRGENSSC